MKKRQLKVLALFFMVEFSPRVLADSGLSISIPLESEMFPANSPESSPIKFVTKSERSANRAVNEAADKDCLNAIETKGSYEVVSVICHPIPVDSLDSSQRSLSPFNLNFEVISLGF